MNHINEPALTWLSSLQIQEVKTSCWIDKDLAARAFHTGWQMIPIQKPLDFNAPDLHALIKDLNSLLQNEPLQDYQVSLPLFASLLPSDIRLSQARDFKRHSNATLPFYPWDGLESLKAGEVPHLMVPGMEPGLWKIHTSIFPADQPDLSSKRKKSPGNSEEDKGGAAGSLSGDSVPAGSSPADLLPAGSSPAEADCDPSLNSQPNKFQNIRRMHTDDTAKTGFTIAQLQENHECISRYLSGISDIDSHIDPDLYMEAFWLTREFEIEETEKNSDDIWQLGLENIQGAVYVYVDDIFVGFSKSSPAFTGFEIQQAIKAGSNRVSILVLPYSTSSWLELGRCYFGIGNIEMVHYPAAARIQSLEISSRVAFDLEEASLLIELDDAPRSMHVQLQEPDGTEVLNFVSSNPLLRLDLYELKLWSMEIPRLYTLTLEVVDENEKPLRTVERKIGLRSVRERNGVWLLNNKRMVLKGLILEGGFFEENLDYKQCFVTWKQEQVNAITLPFTPSPAVLDLADQYGIGLITDLDVHTARFPGIRQGFERQWKKEVFWRLEKQWDLLRQQACILALCQGITAFPDEFEHDYTRSFQEQEHTLILPDALSEKVCWFTFTNMDKAERLLSSHWDKPCIFEGNLLLEELEALSLHGNFGGSFLLDHHGPWNTARFDADVQDLYSPWRISFEKRGIRVENRNQFLDGKDRILIWTTWDEGLPYEQHVDLDLSPQTSKRYYASSHYNPELLISAGIAKKTDSSQHPSRRELEAVLEKDTWKAARRRQEQTAAAALRQSQAAGADHAEAQESAPLADTSGSQEAATTATQAVSSDAAACTSESTSAPSSVTAASAAAAPARPSSAEMESRDLLPDTAHAESSITGIDQNSSTAQGRSGVLSRARKNQLDAEALQKNPDGPVSIPAGVHRSGYTGQESGSIQSAQSARTLHSFEQPGSAVSVSRKRKGKEELHRVNKNFQCILGDHYTGVFGNDFVLRFDEWGMYSMTCQSQEILEGRPELSLIHPQNKDQADLIWAAAWNLARKPKLVRSQVSRQAIVLQYDYVIPTIPASRASVSYSISATGLIGVDIAFKQSSELPEIPYFAWSIPLAKPMAVQIQTDRDLRRIPGGHLAHYLHTEYVKVNWSECQLTMTRIHEPLQSWVSDLNISALRFT